MMLFRIYLEVPLENYIKSMVAIDEYWEILLGEFFRY